MTANRILLTVVERRPELPAAVLLALTAAWITVFDNSQFFGSIAAALRPWSATHVLLFASFALLLFALLWLILLLIPRLLLKPFVAVLLLACAVVRYFTHSFDVVLDSEMMRNVFQTDIAEAGELVTPRLAIELLLYGLLPLVLLAWVRVRPAPLWPALATRLLAMTTAWLMIAVTLGLNYGHVALFARAHPELRREINPSYPLYSLARYWHGRSRMPAGPPQATLADAHALTASSRPRLVVLVLGETARAANFGLNGYARQTTPELAREPLINFRDAWSCGTATAQSLPCMFSPRGHAGYTQARAAAEENLLDALHYAGVNVLWRDNNSGCKGVCARVEKESLHAAKDPRYCRCGECYDEILLRDLDAILAGRDAGRDQFIVLHQKGSHGPAYYRRHPPAFTRFTPECESAQVQDCEPQAIVNAYDNTVLYTDHVLAQTIAWLRHKATRYDTLMLYVSDHGESLGEAGIYLHGLPYAIAPDVQKHVPMLFWVSPGYAADSGLDLACLQRRASRHVTHDALFHTLLGAFSVRAARYDPALDLLGNCRQTLLTEGGGGVPTAAAALPVR